MNNENNSKSIAEKARAESISLARVFERHGLLRLAAEQYEMVGELAGAARVRQAFIARRA